MDEVQLDFNDQDILNAKYPGGYNPIKVYDAIKGVISTKRKCNEFLDRIKADDIKATYTIKKTAKELLSILDEAEQTLIMLTGVGIIGTMVENKNTSIDPKAEKIFTQAHEDMLNTDSQEFANIIETSIDLNNKCLEKLEELIDVCKEYKDVNEEKEALRKEIKDILINPKSVGTWWILFSWMAYLSALMISKGENSNLISGLIFGILAVTCYFMGDFHFEHGSLFKTVKFTICFSMFGLLRLMILSDNNRHPGMEIAFMLAAYFINCAIYREFWINLSDDE